MLCKLLFLVKAEYVGTYDDFSAKKIVINLSSARLPHYLKQFQPVRPGT